MENLVTKYAILTKRTDLKLRIPGVSPDELSDKVESITVDAGNLIKIFNSNSVAFSAGTTNKYCTVQLLDYKDHNMIWENLYECPQSHLKKINEDLWPYVIAITNLQRRLRLTQNGEKCKQIIYLRENDLVNVSGELFQQGNPGYDCIIRYIGPVKELGTVGYFFGLELLHLDNGISPQSENNTFSSKYMECDASLSIFATAEFITPISGEVKSKFSAREIINDTIQKACSTFNNYAYGSTKSSSLKRAGSAKRHNKKGQPEQTTAQFYVEPINLTNHNFQEKNNNQQEAECLDLDIKESVEMVNGATINANLKGKSRLQKVNNSDKDNMQATTKNLNDPNSTAEDELISFEAEEFKQGVENYEKNIERQYSSATASANIPNIGILKNGRGAAKDNSVKPLTIMSLDGRDVVVIDNADIKECTKNESNIIVVDKQRQQNEVDLVDLLGGNWPNNAGDAALVLNRAQDQKQCYGTGGSSSNSSVSSYSNPKLDRNKSPNFLSHMATKGIHKDVNRVRSSETASQTTANNSIKTATNAQLRKCENKNKTSVYDNLTHSDANSISMGASVPAIEEFENSSSSDILPDGLGVGSMIEISNAECDLYGVIRWIGTLPDSQNVSVGVELEDEQDYTNLPTNDGSYNGVPLFKCQEGRALFVHPNQCSKDRRFEDVDSVNTKTNRFKRQTDSKMFGSVECPSVPGAVAPLKIFNLEELEKICGKFKGIQGHHNSCYLDATLFSMFTFTHVFDSLLFRPSESDDISHYEEVQKVLREEIVNPLRKNIFVRADRVMKLRQLLDKLSSVSGLTNEEKDPEEFLNSLLTQIMRVEPFLKLSSGQDAYFYQLFVEKDERLSFPSVQQLFEQSFHSSDIKLKEVPSCLIIQMPRFGKNYKMYPRILPSQVLDVTDIIEDSPRQCSVCGKLAEFECRDCFGSIGSIGLESTAFCEICLKTAHQHAKRMNHKSKEVSVPQDFKIMAEHMGVPRLYMELFAVVCIETSHYVAFVKAGPGADAPWCFFDSMADRKGEQNGYNIPELLTVPNLPSWLSEEGARTVNETFSSDKMLPEHAKRLFCDAYMCMYQSADVMMYR